MERDVIAALEDHGNLFQGGVSGPLSNAVHGYLHLSCTVQYPLKGVCGGHSQVIVAVGGDYGLVNIWDIVYKILYLLPVLSGSAVACCIWYVYSCGTGLYYSLYNLCKVSVFCPSGILSVKLQQGGYN